MHSFDTCSGFPVPPWPTFPALSLKFRTSGFPQYGFKRKLNCDLRYPACGLSARPTCPDSLVLPTPYLLRPSGLWSRMGWARELPQFAPPTCDTAITIRLNNRLPQPDLHRQGMRPCGRRAKDAKYGVLFRGKAISCYAQRSSFSLRPLRLRGAIEFFEVPLKHSATGY